MSFLQKFSAFILFLSLVDRVTALEPSSLPDSVKEEIRYIKGLQKLRLHDYAKLVLEQLKREQPGIAATIKVLELENVLAKGEFDKAKAIIAREPDQNSQEAWAMRLALGDHYYAWGKYAEAQGIYRSLFDKYPNGPPETLNSFYVDSAYKYAQMLLLMGQDKAAVSAFRNVLKAKVERHVARQVNGEMAELMLKLGEQADAAERKKYFAEVTKVCNELLWLQDLWFGKAIVMMAHMKMIEGDVDGAVKFVNEYMKQLKDIDKSLRQQAEETGEDLVKLSPMAECRYFLGIIMQEEAERLLAGGGGRDKAKELLAGKATGTKNRKKRSPGALQHFLNVFIRYPSTTWAPDAGTRAGRVEDILKREFNARISKSVTDEQMEKVKQAQFREARSKFNQQLFAEAVESYITALNLFPEGDTSLAAVSELARCYIETQDELYADMVVRYLAERFNKNPNLMSRAGDELLRIAEVYNERKMPDRKDAVYDVYFSFLKEHPRAPAMLFMFGEKKYGQKDFDGALQYYRQIQKHYTNSPVFFNAVNKIALCHSKTGNHAAEIKTLREYIGKRSKVDAPGHGLISARFRLASAYKQLAGHKSIVKALKTYNELIKLLSKFGDENNRYQKTMEEKEANRKILEGSMYYKASCYAMLKKPLNKLKAYKMQSIKTLSRLVAKFPESTLGPAALSRIGTLHTVLNQPDEARKALEVLQKKYPASPEAKNALFMLGSNLLQMGMRKQAVTIFKEMFEGAGRYSDAQILTAGHELLKAGEYEIAIEAFDRVLGSADKRAMIEPSMYGKGKALIEQKKYEEGAKVLDRMLTQYPNSGYTVEACLYLGRAYSELGMREPDENTRFDLFNSGMKSMKRVRQFVKDKPGTRSRSTVEIARIYELKALAEEQFGTAEYALEYRNKAIMTYQILINLGDFRDPDVRLWIGEAYHECIPLLIQTGRLENAIDDCDKCLRLFPRSKHVLDVRKWRSRTKVQFATKAAPAPEAGE